MSIRRKAVWAAAISALAVAVVARAEQYRTAPQAHGRIPFAEFKKLWDRDAVLVLDVRDAVSYRSGHIPGSILLPLDLIPSKAGDLKKETRPIVAYCA